MDILPPLAERRIFSPLLGIYSQITFILALALPIQSSVRPILIASTLLAHLYICFYTSTFNASSDYGIGCAIMGRFVTAVELLVLTRDVQREMWPLSQKEGPNVADQSFGQRFKWACKLYPNLRGAGWNFQIPGLNTAELKSTSRWRFVGKRLVTALFCYLVLDTVKTFHSYSDIYPKAGHDAQSMLRLPYWWRSVHVVAYGASAYAMLDIQFAIASAITVATGISKPEDWPNAFGTISDAWTIRRFWSRTWHQMLRRVFSSSTTSIAAAFNIPPSSKVLISVIRVWVSFLLSAVIHCTGDYMMAGTIRISLNFFLLQPIGILVEDAVISAFGKRASTHWKWLGYFWVLGWFTFSAFGFVDGLNMHGLNSGEVVPISFGRGLLRGQWRVEY